MLRDLQRQHGSDPAIARAIGVCKETVAARRNAVGCPSWGSGRKPPPIELISDEEWTRRLKGRRYDDPENVTFKP
jgi:hypothetical protein